MLEWKSAARMRDLIAEPYAGYFYRIAKRSARIFEVRFNSIFIDKCRTQEKAKIIAQMHFDRSRGQ